MNQTKKRLAIIKLAVSMTDTETIQLQVLKLGLLKTDSKLKEILSVLSDHNYAQAQILISNYITADSETAIVQRSSSKEDREKKEETLPLKDNEAPLTVKEKIQQEKDKAIIEQFELFSDISQEETPEKVDDYSTYLNTTPDSQNISTQAVNYDTLLNVNATDILTNNISLDISEEPEEGFFKKEGLSSLASIPKDDFFNIDETKEDNVKPLVEEKLESPTEISPTEEESKEEKSVAIEEQVHIYFKAIPYIDQKFKNMQIQYPPVHESGKYFSSVDAWLFKISNKGYTELEVEQMIKQVENLSNTNKAEAAKLLLINAATESKYAHFRLARALYQGELLQKNLPEAFTLINRLAVNDDYPEAICDLAQFYENGIGITKDKKKAELLYKEAMDLGIHRAMNHYERICKENKGFFSFKK